MEEQVLETGGKKMRERYAESTHPKRNMPEMLK